MHVSYTACSLPHVGCFCRGSTVTASVLASWRSPAAGHGQFRRDLKTILFAQPYHLVDSALRVLSKQSSYINYSHFYLLTYTTFARARTHAHTHTHTHTHRLDHVTPCLVIQVIGIVIWKPTTMSFESDTASAKIFIGYIK